jgi:hypothetical protein
MNVAILLGVLFAAVLLAAVISRSTRKGQEGRLQGKSPATTGQLAEPATVAGRRSGEDLLVGGFGLITSLLTAVSLWGIERRFDIAIYTWMYWFVIPVGAGLAGFAGASGYYVGSRLFNHRPSNLLLLNIILASLATFGLIHYLSYSTLVVDGKQVSQYISFWRYLDLAIRSASMQFGFRTANLGETGAMGSFGYVPALLQVIGFAIGGFVVFGYLVSTPYCANCARYLSAKGKQVRYSVDADTMQENTAHVLHLFGEGDAAAAIEHHRKFGMALGKAQFRSSIAVRACKKCGRHWIKFEVAKSVGSEWKDLPEVGLTGFIEGAVELRNQ